MDDRKKARKIFSRIGGAYFIFLAAAMGVQFIVVLAIFLAGGKNLSLGQDIKVAISMACMYGAGFPLYWILVKRVPGRMAEYRKNNQAEVWGPGQLIVCMIISISVMEAGNFVGSRLMNILGQAAGETEENLVFQLISESNLLTLGAFTVVAAPIMEELMFRKLLIDRIIQYGDWTAILVSGVMFGLIHGNFYQFFYACGLGMIFAYIYIRTGKIKYTIGLHMIINFMSSMIAGNLIKAMDYQSLLQITEDNPEMMMEYLAANWLPLTMLMLYGLALIVLAVAGVILAICFRKRIHLYPAMEKISWGEKYLAVFLNIGMVLFLAMCTVQFVI